MTPKAGPPKLWLEPHSRHFPFCLLSPKMDHEVPPFSQTDRSGCQPGSVQARPRLDPAWPVVSSPLGPTRSACGRRKGDAAAASRRPRRSPLGTERPGRGCFRWPGRCQPPALCSARWWAARVPGSGDATGRHQAHVGRRGRRERQGARLALVARADSRNEFR